MENIIEISIDIYPELQNKLYKTLKYLKSFSDIKYKKVYFANNCRIPYIPWQMEISGEKHILEVFLKVIDYYNIANSYLMFEPQNKYTDIFEYEKINNIEDVIIK